MFNKRSVERRLGIWRAEVRKTKHEDEEDKVDKRATGWLGHLEQKG